MTCELSGALRADQTCAGFYHLLNSWLTQNLIKSIWVAIRKQIGNEKAPRRQKTVKRNDIETD